MANRGPTLINLPPPPSDPTTPNDMGPGTPNSGTTSLSALSVVAIKDGSIGHGGRGGNASANTLEAERADRISRLAGLERVTASRNPSGYLAPGTTSQYPPGYFDNTPLIRERSTVGSASATGSVGGRTTWASGSVDYDLDKMSEEQDDGVSSTSGFSDGDKASLVGFGEGAESTVSGPVSTSTARSAYTRGVAGPPTPRTGAIPPTSGQSTPMSGIIPSSAIDNTDPKMMDGMSYDANIVDTTMQPAPPVDQSYQSNRMSGVGSGMTETTTRDKVNDEEKPMGTPDEHNLGKFPFEK